MITNVCVRCGKERILTKTWEEPIDKSGATIKRSLYICPDSDCQAKLEATFAANKKAAEERQAATERREAERQASRAKAILQSRHK